MTTSLHSAKSERLSYSFAPKQALTHDHLLTAFEQQVQMQPHAIAAVYLTESITYQQLDQYAELLACHLYSKGVRPGHHIGVFLHRSIEMLIAKIACFKLATAYVPQHAKVAPVKQMQYIVTAAALDWVLTLEDYSYLANALTCQVANLSTLLPELATRAAHAAPTNRVRPRYRGYDTAFVLFTSGTTGTPNGVAVSHHNVANIVLTEPGNLGIRPGTRVAQLLAIGFDMAAWEIWGCLCNGGELVVRGDSIQTACEQADIIIATPSILDSLHTSKLHHVQRAIVAGEPCPEPLARHWAQFCDFYNACGPTETTIVNTISLYRPDRPLAIGAPTANNSVYVLDDQLNPLALGEVGMMWAGGACVTKGYINNDMLNKERYRDDPFISGKKMFRTGDLGRWNEYGELEHLGRADDQVKVRGFRVELDAVSQIIEQLEGVTRAVALKLDANNLVAFYCGSPICNLAYEEMFKQALPYYCKPSAIAWLPQLPTTERGKIDKRQLAQTARAHFSQLLTTAGTSEKESTQ